MFFIQDPSVNEPRVSKDCTEPKQDPNPAYMNKTGPKTDLADLARLTKTITFTHFSVQLVVIVDMIGMVQRRSTR